MPQAKLLAGADGALYGTTYQGGTGACTDSLYNVIGCGVVFRLAPPASQQTEWTETVIHDFAGPEGAFPQAGLVADGTGALIGTASGGGPVSYGVVGGYGVVFRLGSTRPGTGSLDPNGALQFRRDKQRRRGHRRTSPRP